MRFISFLNIKKKKLIEIHFKEWRNTFKIIWSRSYPEDLVIKDLGHQQVYNLVPQAIQCNDAIEQDWASLQ